ncbi:MAG: glyoxalase [Novosphingobium sp. 12-64-8]|nr:MAG: glyoxalase [Novosphingobium sp. 12-64-8]
MGNPPGSFIWYELMTTDADAAGAFYNAVVGWTFSGREPGSPVDYRMIGRSDGGMNGGVLSLTAEMQQQGARPGWFAYLHVADVDAAVAAIQADGGKVLMPKTTIEVGSFAFVTDPQGVPFYVMSPIPPADKPDATSDVFSPDEPQHVRWNELGSPDLAAAKAFYAKHFGFEFNNVMPMGPMGDYCFIDHHGQALGAIMQQQNTGQPAMWLPYFGVPSTMAAKVAIEASGGTVLSGPHEVPGEDWVVVASDPQGAVFGVVGPKGE